MKLLILFIPILMAFRYTADTGRGMLNRLTFMAAFGFVGLLLHSCRAKESLRKESRLFMVASIAFAAVHTVTIYDYLERAEAISRATALVVAFVPIGVLLVAVTCRPSVRLMGPFSQVAIGMIVLMLAGMTASQLGVENVQGSNIEASGTDLISRERSGLVFLGGVVPSATFIAVALAAFVPALLASNRRLRLLSIAVILVGLTVVSLTATRGALVMFIIVGLGYASGLVRRLSARPMLSAAGVLGVALLIPVVYPWVLPYLDDMEINRTLEPLRRESQSSVFDLTGRVEIWERSLQHFNDWDQWLRGYGFEAEVASGLSAQISTIPHPALEGREDLHAHNAVFNLMFSGGLMATVPYLVMLFVALKRAFAHSHDPHVASLLAMLLTWVGIGIHESMLWPHIYYFYFVILGIMAEIFLVTPETSTLSAVRTKHAAQHLPVPMEKVTT